MNHRENTLRAVRFERPEYIPISDAPYTGRMFKRGELPEPLPYDPVEAGRLLDAAGWLDTDGDGIRKKQGQEFRFNVIVPSGWEQMAAQEREIRNVTGQPHHLPAQDPVLHRSGR